MTVLNLSYGWEEGDDVKVLIAGGLTVGEYQIDTVRVTMNELGAMSSGIVSSIKGLLGEYQDAQDRMVELNNNADGKVLIKADVLEWSEAKGVQYSPEREVMRIRGLIYQYMASCPLFGGGVGNLTMLYRS
jgi:hypothetical protein